MRSTSEMLIHSRETIGDVPPELIGASTALAGSKLYLFGGSLASAPEPKPLSDLYVLDLELWKWEIILPATEDSVGARYFHTIDIWRNHLVVFGGLGTQGDSEQLQVLSDVRMFNLSTRRWLRPPRVPAMSSSTPVPRPRHAHISCVSSNQLFVIGGKGFFGEALDDLCVYDLGKKEWIHRQFSPIPRLDMNHSFAATSQWHVRTPPLEPSPSEKTDNILQPTPLSYSDPATNKSPCDIYLYNAEHLQRKLETLSPLPDGAIQTKKQLPGAIGSQLPFLRFPSGVILGKTLILAGNLSVEDTEHNAFLIWTLDLETNVWLSIETGDLLKNGSWAKGYLWHEENKFLAFGKRGGSFVDAADRLVLGWDAVAVVDLETLGIYQPPPLKLDVASQRLGLALLADSKKKADYDFLCEDGRQIPCSRKTILDRWPWFREQYARLGGADASIKHQKRTEITITQASATLAQSYPVTMALLQYFYSLALGTALQRAPAVLSYLLLISTEFQIPHLRALVRHAMHLVVNEATADGVYEIAASCGCRSLQIR
ncbi:hypothetical protein B0H19DRAFT_1297705 [Mycena capillaripes]|nr:hypothetical protein B0H19DRAFT_1297705 [Mycena capillaripes]